MKAPLRRFHHCPVTSLVPVYACCLFERRDTNSRMGLQAANLCALARLSREPRPCKSDRLRNRQSLLCEEQAPKPDGTEIKHCLLTFHPPNGADPFPKYKVPSLLHS